MTEKFTIQQIYNLAFYVLTHAGSNKEQAKAVADVISKAEQDGSVSHGLFRLPGYFASLKSGKIKTNPNPKITQVTPMVLNCNGDNCFAPLVHSRYLDKLIQVTKKFGLGVLAIRKTAHFSALWHETEYIANNNLVGVACTSYLPCVAPYGTTNKLYGTNPFSFAWPRKNDNPLVFDMATASIALGDVMIAARDGKKLPENIGLDENGNITSDPKKILKGMLLTFGGYKGSHISMMVELLSGPLLGETSSYETEMNNINDGGPPLGGQFIMALCPEIISHNNNWAEKSENFIKKLSSLNGIRIPGERRHKNRKKYDKYEINKELIMKINSLLTKK